MGEFRRSPSKVWWLEEWPRHSSQSAGSQDSGFSDTETSPQGQQEPKDVNLTSNVKPKLTPKKISLLESNGVPTKRVQEVQSEPRKVYREEQEERLVKSEPRRRFQRNGSLKASRSLFEAYQYAREVDGEVDVTEDSSGLRGVEKFHNAADIVHHDKNNNDRSKNLSDRELESAFRSLLDQPKHTSTPKTRSLRIMRHKKRGRLYSLRDERLCQTNFDEQPSSVQNWIDEVKHLYEPECMITLQSKSIMADLVQKVALIGGRMTSKLRKLLNDSQMISAEFETVKRQKQYTGPLAQSLARLVEEFARNYSSDTKLLKICEQIRVNSKEVPVLVAQLNTAWDALQVQTLLKEAKNLVNELEDPQSEIHVRAALTGLTSLALRHKEIIGMFISCNAVSILCVLCEKCESSTVRSLALRALSTICTNSVAVRRFESTGGLQLITEVVADESRPEPERAEAVALLAQVTAPWIEDNHKLQLDGNVKILVKYLTSFIASTKCCQNLLLCTAALANLTEMEPKSAKYILHQNSIGQILKVIKIRRSIVSIYLLEQVATLIANLSQKVHSRKLLIEEHAPAALLHFLHCTHGDPEVESRLQQKSIIALSRLSSDTEGAQQIVSCEGVDKLVRLCRERNARHDSDAVLVAALATLRKVAEACGSSVIDAVDVQELVEPKLLDSFLAYSTQHESYV